MRSFFRSQAAAYVLLPLACACWAGNHVVARAIAGHAPPASVSLARWVVVFVLVSIFAWPQIRADWTKLEAKAGVLTFLALVGGTAFGTLQFVALQYTTALNMGVVGSVSPAFIVAASYILFRDRLGPSQLFGVAVSLVGVLAIVTQLDPERLLTLTFNGGDLIILVNMAFWAIYCACLHLRPAVHPMSFLFVIAYVAALGNAPFAAWEYAVGLPARSRPADGVGRALCGALHQPARLHDLEPRHRSHRRAAGQRLPAHHPAVQRAACHLAAGREADARSTSSASC